MKKLILISVLYAWAMLAYTQERLEGRVYAADNNGVLTRATLSLVAAGQQQHSSATGTFSLLFQGADTLVVSHVGYIKQRIPIMAGRTKTLDIFLVPHANSLEEVMVNTGYYELPKERATGSFTHIDNELLNRSVGADILQRLEGIAPGVQFVNAGGTSPSDIRVRGVATIESNESPLVVVDNFPYERDLSTINPNDVESITVLRDAAAASIWGARAGNGVIVITTKQGRYNQKTQISVSSNFTMGDRPDLFYSQSRLPSTTIMEIEKELFERGNYAEQPQTVIPAYVELLIKQRDGLITETDFSREEALMRQTDVRNEAMRYLYKGERHQQYALNVSGGGESYRYYFASGYDKNDGVLVGNGSERLNINLQNTFRPLKGLEVTAGIWYSQQWSENNGIGLGNLNPATGREVATYSRLVDGEGNALAIPYERRLAYYDEAHVNGLLDWHYRPVDELAHTERNSESTEYRLNTNIKYSFLNVFNFQANYQYLREAASGQSYYSPDSYYVRNLVNRFTQANGTRIVPYGGILSGQAPIHNSTHSGRMQLNYSHPIGNDHNISALVGGEIRQIVNQSFPGFTKYNYDKNLLTGTANFSYTQAYPTNPTGSGRLAAPNVSMSHYTDRFLSYFGNVAYTYRERYTLSGSLRWDASNLFGVKTNQRGVPLWSVGGSWEASKENIYLWHTWLPYLRLRATYGSAGNVNKRVSVFPVVIYSSDGDTGLPRARVTSVGNPSLRWEQVNTANFAVDFRAGNQWLTGSIEYYTKNAKDLIGNDFMAPSTGIGTWSRLTNKINYASLHTEGWDIQLSSRNLTEPLKWQTDVFFSYVQNRITHFNTTEVSAIGSYFSNPPPVIGQSRDVVYALPWYGLDHETGSQLMYVGNIQTRDHREFYDSHTTSDLVTAGVKVPPFYGSLRNTLSWKRIEMSANVLFKKGYVFRRSSMYPGQEYFGNAGYHMDYFRRWENVGDERTTDVPAWAENFVPYTDAVYLNSEVLVTKGDHLRLQDVSIAYAISQNQSRMFPFQRIRLYAYARNLGIVWRANKNGIDPDYVNVAYLPPMTIAVGTQIEF